MLIDHKSLSLIVSSPQLQAVSRAGNLGTYIHLPIKLTLKSGTEGSHFLFAGLFVDTCLSSLDLSRNAGEG